MNFTKSYQMTKVLLLEEIFVKFCAAVININLLSMTH